MRAYRLLLRGLARIGYVPLKTATPGMVVSNVLFWPLLFLMVLAWVLWS